MHFKMYPDWTNCRSLTSDSDTWNSTVSFSQHQDSSTTVAAKVKGTKLLKSCCSMSWQSLDQNLRRSIISTGLGIMRSWDDYQKDPIEATKRATAAVKQKLILYWSIWILEYKGLPTMGRPVPDKNWPNFTFSHISFCLELNRSKVAKEGTLVVYKLSK